MPRKRKPHEERKPEDYMEAADNALELAKTLAGQGGVSDQDFLERIARSDELVDHDGTTCGQCHYTILGAAVAREMIEAGEYEDFRLWQAEVQAGRDRHQAFRDRGWER